MVVDVNPFPGFRGAREPAESLLRFLSTVDGHEDGDGMSTATRPARPGVTGATEALDGYLARQGGDRTGHRCGTCVASPVAGWSPSSGRATAGDIYTVTVDEDAAHGGAGRRRAAPARRSSSSRSIPQLAAPGTPSWRRPSTRPRATSSSPPHGGSSTCRRLAAASTSSPSPSGTSPATGA